jgi:hypothetical protein
MKDQIRFLQTKNYLPRFFKKTLTYLGIVAIAMLVLGGSASAQDKVAVSSLQKDASTAVWHSLKTVSGVEILYQYVDCGPVEYVLFKIDNKTANKVSVSWKYKHFNNGTEVALNADDANVVYPVNANSALTGICNGENTRLNVFVREGGHVLSVTDIELVDITVSIL